MNGYMPTSGDCRWRAREHRAAAEMAKNHRKRVAHLEIAAVLEAEANSIDRDNDSARVTKNTTRANKAVIA